MRWAEFQSLRAERHAAATAAAEALRAGEAAPAAALLGAWAFGGHPELGGVVLRRLLDTPPQPAPALGAAFVSPGPDDAPTHPDEAELSERGHLRRLARRRRPAAVPAPDPVAWGLDALAVLGEELATKERRRWEEEARRLARPPADDHAAAWERDVSTAWRGWAAWTVTTPPADEAARARREHLRRTQAARWARVAEPDVRASFELFLAALELAPDRRELVREGLSTGLHDQMLGLGGERPGWHELAVRVLETGPEGPVLPLVRHLDEVRLGRFFACAVEFGLWAGSLRELVPGAGTAPSRADRLRRLTAAAPERVEAWMEAHGALRVLADWARPGLRDGGDLDRAHRVLLQARGVARGRLRALVAELPGEELLAAVGELRPLAARTRAALRRYAWSWARQEQDRGFPLAGDRLVHPPCRQEEDWIVRFPDRTVGAIRAWVLLTVLRGHGEALRRWADTGASDPSGGWGRALLAAPPAARDPEPRPYARLRLWLHQHLPTLLDELRPLCEAVAELPAGPGLKEAMAPLLTPWLDGPPPARGYPRFRAEALRFLTGPALDLDRETP